jgi:ribonuclease Z
LIAVGALVAAAIVRWQQAAIGAWLFDRAVQERVGRDVTATLPDGLHVALCGTGSPLPNPARAGPCNIVIAGKRIFVVDIGEGGARNIGLMGVPAGRIEALLLTHFHSDHVDGIGPLMLARWTGGAAATPLPVIGGDGVAEVVAGFNAAYRIDNGYRTAHHGPAIVPPGGAGALARAFSLPAEGAGDTAVVLDDSGLKITAIRVDHGPIKPAVAYRFDYQGRSVVISGDTSKSAALARGAQGADILIHDALQPRLVGSMTKALDTRGQPKLAQITRDIQNYHATPEQATETAEAAGVRHLVLSHLVPPIPSAFFYPAFLGDARSRFKGALTVGEDGMLFSLPAGTENIEIIHLLDN